MPCGKESFIFLRDVNVLITLLLWYNNLEFNKVDVLGIFLAFPSILAGNVKSMDTEIATLFEDFQKSSLIFPSGGLAEENVETYLKLCREIQVFHTLGRKKGGLMIDCYGV